MDVKKILFAVAFGTLVAGCQTTGTTTAIQQIEKPPLNLPPVDQVKMSELNWYVITKNAKSNEGGHIDQAFRKANSSSLYALSAKGYENLSVNNAKMVATIKQLQSQIRSLKEYYESKPAANTAPAANQSKKQ